MIITLFINACIAVKSWPTVSTSDTVVQADYLAIAPGKKKLELTYA